MYPPLRGGIPGHRKHFQTGFNHRQGKFKYPPMLHRPGDTQTIFRHGHRKLTERRMDQRPAAPGLACGDQRLTLRNNIPSTIDMAVLQQKSPEHKASGSPAEILHPGGITAGVLMHRLPSPVAALLHHHGKRHAAKGARAYFFLPVIAAIASRQRRHGILNQ
ncbi:hypothetical protein D3C76_1241560 [compost metagenome]